MSEHVLNVRERGSEDKRFWSPERDITVVYPKLLRYVFVTLEQALSDGEGCNALVKQIKEKFNVSEDDLMQLAKAYAKLISCVEQRKNIKETLDCVDFLNTPGQAIVALLALQKLTSFFVDKYKCTLLKGVEDANIDLIEELEEILKYFKPYDGTSKT